MRRANVVLLAATIGAGAAAVVCAWMIIQARTIIGASQAPAGILKFEPQTLPAIPARHPRSTTQPAIRCAVIGGMFETGFWNALADRYEQQTGVYIDLIASGPKQGLDRIFRDSAGVDLITMHASDTIVNLVADGYCQDPQPWMRNDLLIVGPPDDPAGIHGMADAAAALAKIAATHSLFVVHSSLGAQEVLRNILEPNDIHLDEQKLTILFLDNQRNVLKVAARLKAYTLVGRIPFCDGKLQNEGLVPMVRGDPRLRRPYMVAIADPRRVFGAHVEEAVRLAHWMRDPATQAWISQFGRGVVDDQPLFFPVAVPEAGTRVSSHP